MQIGPYMRSALQQYEKKTDFLGNWSTSDFLNWGVGSKQLNKDNTSFGLPTAAPTADQGRPPPSQNVTHSEHEVETTLDGGDVEAPKGHTVAAARASVSAAGEKATAATADRVASGVPRAREEAAASKEARQARQLKQLIARHCHLNRHEAAQPWSSLSLGPGTESSRATVTVTEPGFPAVDEESLLHQCCADDEESLTSIEVVAMPTRLPEEKTGEVAVVLDRYAAAADDVGGATSVAEDAPAEARPAAEGGVGAESPLRAARAPNAPGERCGDPAKGDGAVNWPLSSRRCRVRHCRRRRPGRLGRRMTSAARHGTTPARVRGSASDETTAPSRKRRVPLTPRPPLRRARSTGTAGMHGFARDRARAGVRKSDVDLLTMAEDPPGLAKLPRKEAPGAPGLSIGSAQVNATRRCLI